MAPQPGSTHGVEDSYQGVEPCDSLFAPNRAASRLIHHGSARETSCQTSGTTRGSSSPAGPVSWAKAWWRGCGDAAPARSRSRAAGTLTSAAGMTSCGSDPAPAGGDHPSGGRGGWHRRQSTQPRTIPLRQPDHGGPAHGAGAPHGVHRLVALGTVCAYPKFTPVAVSTRTSSGTATPRRPTRPTVWPRRCCSFRRRRTAQQYGFDAIHLLPVNLYGPRRQLRPGIAPTSSRRSSASASRRSAAGLTAIAVWGTGSATREFLYVDDCAEAILLATERYRTARPDEPGLGLRDLHHATSCTRSRAFTGFRGEIRWDDTKPDGQRAAASTCPGRGPSWGFEAKMPLEEGLRRTIEWYAASVGLRV